MTNKNNMISETKRAFTDKIILPILQFYLSGCNLIGILILLCSKFTEDFTACLK